MDTQLLQRARVLVVDDHPMVREMVRLACGDVEALDVVGEAGDGASAIERARELRPHVVVLDLILPRVDGFDVVERLREEVPDARILVLSARDDPESVLAAIRAGVDGYLDKSASVEAIADAVARVATGERVFPQEHQRKAHAQLGRIASRARLAASAAASLTKRERQVLDLLSNGLTTRQIASALNVSERTAESHIGSLYSKLDVRTRVQAVHRAASLGLIDLERAAAR